MARATAAEKAFEAAQAAIAKAAETGATALSLSGNPFRALDRIPGEIAGLTGLTGLSLLYTGVSDLEPLRGMTGLTGLSLSGTGVSDLEPLRGMTGLTGLYLSGTGVSDLEPLRGMTGLTGLDLSGTEVSDLEPLRGMTGLTGLGLTSTRVSDLEPLRGMTGLTELDLSDTGVSDLEPLRGMTGLNYLHLQSTWVSRAALQAALRGKTTLIPSEEANETGTLLGVHLEDCLAARDDARIAEIAGIEDDRERTIALFEELGLEWQSSSEDSGDIEQRLRGPVLAESIADVSKEADRFEATSIEDGPDREEDGRYHDLLETLSFAAERLAGTETANRIATGVAENFADYYKFSSRRPINARLLNYLAAGIRTALIDEDTRISLDAFDLSKISGFLEEHDTLVRDYHSTALQGPLFEVTTDPEVLLRELFPKLGVARDILKKADEDGLFAPSVSDALEMLNRRAEGARKRLFTSDDPKEREQAVADLRRSSVLVTAYLGRIKGRLVQWTKKQAEHTKENPLQTSVNVWAMVEIAKAVIKAVTPVFESLWRLIGNLPLPF